MRIASIDLDVALVDIHAVQIRRRWQDTDVQVPRVAIHFALRADIRSQRRETERERHLQREAHAHIVRAAVPRRKAPALRAGPPVIARRVRIFLLVTEHHVSALAKARAPRTHGSLHTLSKAT